MTSAPARTSGPGLSTPPCLSELFVGHSKAMVFQRVEHAFQRRSPDPGQRCRPLGSTGMGPRGVALLVGPPHDSSDSTKPSRRREYSFGYPECSITSCQVTVHVESQPATAEVNGGSEDIKQNCCSRKDLGSCLQTMDFNSSIRISRQFCCSRQWLTQQT